MANNATLQSANPATPPAGFVVHTDEVTVGGTTAHDQIMKLAVGAAGSSALVSTANPLPTINQIEYRTSGHLSRANINVTASGDNTLIASGGGPIRVFKLFMVTGSALTAKFNEGTATALSGPLSFGQFGGMTLDYDSEPWFEAASGSPFTVNLTATGPLGGRIYYTTA